MTACLRVLFLACWIPMAMASGWVVAFDWKSLDSVLIGPLQHLVGIISGSVAIIVGLPVAIAHLQKFIAFIKQKIQK